MLLNLYVNIFINHVIGAKYPLTLQITNFYSKIWITTFNKVILLNYIFSTTSL